MRAGILVFSAAGLLAQSALPTLGPLLHAHNCYPYGGEWADRIDRALRAAPRVAIEQDLAWHESPGGPGRMVISHERETKGTEPALEAHFFERVRPMVEKALAEDDRSKWPVVILHLDFKENSDRMHRALWEVLGKYESWITTAVKLADPSTVASLDLKPVIVLTEENDLQEENFFHRIPVGGKLRLFGSARPAALPEGLSEEERRHFVATATPGQMLPSPPTNYRRWWNNSWAVIEEGGQQRAGEFTAEDEARLRALVDYAHRLGYWIRFYALNGHSLAEDQGWSEGYNFGSREAVAQRWKAAIAAGVDLIATDQYEDFGQALATQLLRRP